MTIGVHHHLALLHKLNGWTRPRCACRGGEPCARCRAARRAFLRRRAVQWLEQGCCTGCGRALDLQDLGLGRYLCEDCRAKGRR